MDHKTIQEELLMMDGGAKDLETRPDLAAHVAGCAECRGIVEGWGALRSALGRTAPPAGAEAFVASVMDRLPGEERKPVVLRPRWSFSKWFFPALEYGLVALLLVIFIVQNPPAVTAESILLSDVPQASHWVFSDEPVDAAQLVNT